MYMPDTFRFVLFHFAFLFFFGVICFITGRRLLAQVCFHSGWEAAAFPVTLGAGCLATLVFFLGVIGLLHAGVLVGAVMAILAAIILTWPGQPWRSSGWWRRWFSKNRIDSASLALTGLLALAVWVSFRLPLYPPVQWDATEYHLASAKIYAQAHGLVLTEFLRFPVAPQLNQMLFTLALLWYDDIAAQLIQYLLTFVTAAAVFAFAARYFTPLAGLLGAAIWLSSPLVIWSGSSAYIDTGLTLFLGLGVFAFIIYIQEGQRYWLFLTAALLGFAAAVKYPALFVVAICGLVVLWITLRRRRWIDLLIFGAVLLAAGAPFYLRNWIISGNPIFPFGGTIIPQRLWSLEDLERMNLDGTRQGVPRTLAGYLKLPWYWVFEPQRFTNEVTGKPAVSPAFVYLFPFSLLLAARHKTARWLALFILSFTAFWFLSAQSLRYLMPVFPWISVMAAAVVDTALRAAVKVSRERLHMGPWMAKAAVPLAALAFLVWVLLPAHGYILQQRSLFGGVPVTEQQRHAYYQRWLPTYPAYQFLNQQEGRDYALYVFLDENMAYFADGKFMGDWFGPARYQNIFDHQDDSQSLLQVMQDLNATHFLMTYHRGRYELPEDAFFKEHFIPIDQSEHYQLYRIVYP
jgi:4-amino-4-deoxy-L-arabinose transferase-like glycosyltransferase